MGVDLHQGQSPVVTEAKQRGLSSTFAINLRIFQSVVARRFPHATYLVDAFGENRKYAIGSVLADPNGTDVPIDALARLAVECPKLDVLVNVAATSFKRNRLASNVRVDDIVSEVSKRAAKGSVVPRQGVNQQ